MGSSRKFAALALGFVLLLSGLAASAQTWGEIFRQKKTQQKYLLQQIAALEVYIGYARKGYEIVGGGVHLIKDITNGEFSLHKNFFASLASVNPSIKGSVLVSEILDSGLGIVAVLKGWKTADLNTSDAAFVLLVKANLLAECAVELEELIRVITSGKLEMSDDDRLQRLEGLGRSMQDKQQFVLSFSDDLRRLLLQREKEQRSIDQLRRWYEIE